MNQQKSAVVENSPQQPSPPGSPGVLYRWGVLMARRRRAVLAVWGLLLVVCAVAYPLMVNISKPWSKTSSASQSNWTNGAKDSDGSFPFLSCSTHRREMICETRFFCWMSPG